MFEDRIDAGRQLAAELSFLKEKALVLAIPRGGVVVGSEIAKKLKLKLSVLVVRKIGHPLEVEYGLGALSEGNTVVWDDKAIAYYDITKKDLDTVLKNQEKELKRRVLLYRGGKKLSGLAGKSVVLVDDGIATGVSALAAIAAVKKLKPKRIIFATPVCSSDAAKVLKKKVDLFISFLEKQNLIAIGLFYRNFNQVSDNEVIKLLNS